jgi:histidyl-tRNA synthetase
MLRAMASYSGFSEDSFDKVFIILDKMDKIGLEGVQKELEESGFSTESINTYLELFTLLEKEEQPIAFLREKLGDYLDSATADSLETIMDSVKATKASDFNIVFDPTLVRGMSYYTGTIFEVEMADFGSSVAGGGRYDKMIGKFTGKETCACGFSIGFERIITILLEQGFKVPQSGSKVAYLVEKKMPTEKLCDILKQAAEERKAGKQILVVMMNKNKKFQKEQLTKEGYEEFVEFFNR